MAAQRKLKISDKYKVGHLPDTTDEGWRGHAPKYVRGVSMYGGARPKQAPENLLGTNTTLVCAEVYCPAL